MIPLRKAALIGLAMFMGGAMSASAQALKVATVNMQTLFKEYHLTAKAQEEINVERAFIQKENQEKLVDIRDIEEQLGKIRKFLEDPSLSEQKRASYQSEFQELNEEGQALNRARTDYLNRRTRNLNEKMEQRMRGILTEITDLVQERAQKDDYDFVFDKSGLSTTQVPFVLYAKDATDITSSLLVELNKDQPDSNEEVPAEPASE